MKTTNGCQDSETKPIARILPNGLIKYYSSLGVYERIGFGFKNAEKILKTEGYNVKRMRI